MLKQFYEKALPKQGVYCVSAIDQVTGKITNRFAETLDKVFEEVEKLKEKKLNVYVALGSFEGYSRKADDCLYYRSFFVDLDIGADKAEKGEGYATKEEALEEFNKFVTDTGLPPPIRIDSGTGIHAYWLLDEDVPIEDYLPYARKFKDFCLTHINADRAVMADAARIMRCPETLNYKTTPPSPSFFIDTEFPVYTFEDFKNFLGVIEADPDPESVLAHIPKGLDEDTLAMKKQDNFEWNFYKLAQRSLEGSGCNQVKYWLENSSELTYEEWFSSLSIARFCANGMQVIHEVSEDYPGYNREETEKKALEHRKPQTCDFLAREWPSRCEGCQHRGKIHTPIVLGRNLKIADSIETGEPTGEEEPAISLDKEESVWTVQSTQEIPDFPEFLSPFVRGVNGGIYYVPPPKTVKGKVVQEDPVLIFAHEFYPVRRMFSPLDGECMTMRLHLPNDATREFLLPMKVVYSQDKLREGMSSNGVFFDPQNLALIQSYLVKWGQFMVFKFKADVMRMQMGWTEERSSANWDHRSFVIGNREITYKGEEVKAAASPYVRGIAKYLMPMGSYEKWKEAAAQLDLPELELHAFSMLCGFGSILMPYTSTSGVTVSLLGRSGSAKTGALYAALSVFGNPKELSVFDATDNGMTGRYLGLHNLLLGVDEIGNKEAKPLSQLTHKISHGKAKIRMQASVNAEREHEMAASLIAIFTTNESIYSKFEGLKASPDGEAARIVEFFVKKPSILQGEGGGLLGREIFDTFRLNYGHAGPEYVKEVLRVGDSHILECMNYWREKFVNKFGDDSTYRFHENLIMAAFAAGDITNGAGITNLNLERIFNDVVDRMINIREKIIKVNAIDYDTILGDFIYKNLAMHMLIIKEGKTMLEPRGAIVARIDSDKELCQVSKTEFKKYLRELNLNPVEFEDAMREKKILVDDKKGRLTTGWKSAIDPQNVHLYWFKWKVSEDLLLASAESDH